MNCPCCQSTIDLSAIPLAELNSERGRRNNAARKRKRGNPNGRPLVIRTCKKCGHKCGTVAMRSHKCPAGGVM
jgi:hypothetical protein